MVRVGAVQRLDVQRDAGVDREGLEELADQLGVEGADLRRGEARAEDEEGSPLAATVMSSSEGRASWSSMWSKKPTPVAQRLAPVPSSETVTVMLVSLVSRAIVAVRIGVSPG